MQWGLAVPLRAVRALHQWSGRLTDIFIRVTPWEYGESNDCHSTEKQPSSLRTDFKCCLRDLLSFPLNSEVIRHLRFKKSGPWWLE